MAALTAGVSAPSFKLPDMKGSQFSLDEALRKGPVLLAFFKLSCPVCQFALPYLERLHQGLHGKNSPTIVGISQNGQKDTAYFLTQYGVTFPVLLDNPREYPASNAYQITNVPTLFYVGEDGTIEISSVGWSRKDLENISRRVGERAAVGKITVIRPGEEVPEFKAG